LLSPFDIVTTISLALVAGLEAAIEVQRDVLQTEAMISTAGWVRFMPLALLVFAGCVWRCQLVFPRGERSKSSHPGGRDRVAHARGARIGPAAGRAFAGGRAIFLSYDVLSFRKEIRPLRSGGEMYCHNLRARLWARAGYPRVGRWISLLVEAAACRVHLGEIA
jgi:hypothetical protein